MSSSGTEEESKCKCDVSVAFPAGLHLHLAELRFSNIDWTKLALVSCFRNDWSMLLGPVTTPTSIGMLPAFLAHHPYNQRVTFVVLMRL